MNKEVIKNTIKMSLAGKMTFPQVVGALINEGIEFYHVDMLRSETRYYATTGDSMVESIDLVHPTIAKEFSASKVEAAVRKIQGGNSTYIQFMNEISDAGCVYYIANLAGKNVSYFGRLGDCHTEHFPSKP